MDQQSAKNAKRVLNGRRNARQRQDFRPSEVVPHDSPVQVVDDDAAKLDRYRNRFLALVLPGLSNELANRLTQRTLESRDAQAVNSTIALYSDGLQYARFCKANQLPVFPLDNSTFIEYLNMMQREKKPLSGT